jgi:hypothetical protein
MSFLPFKGHLTLRGLAVLQWLGLLVGAAAWAGQLVVGFGITQAACGAAGSGWGIRNDTWQVALLSASVLAILVAEAAAVTVVLRTRGTSYEGAPPAGRVRFFAIAAVAANVIFLMIVVLSGTASIADVACRQA